VAGLDSDELINSVGKNLTKTEQVINKVKGKGSKANEILT